MEVLIKENKDERVYDNGEAGYNIDNIVTYILCLTL